MSKRTLYDVYDYEANTGNYDPIAPNSKIKPLPETNVSGKVLVSVAGSEERNAEWTSDITLNHVTSSTGQILSLDESQLNDCIIKTSNLDQCKVLDSESVQPGILKYINTKLKYVGDDGANYVISATKESPFSGNFKVGTGGDFGTLKQAVDYCNYYGNDSLITLTLLNDIILTEPVILRRNYYIKSNNAYASKLIVNFTDYPAYMGPMIALENPTGVDHYHFKCKLENIWFSVLGNDHAYDGARFLYNHACIKVGTPTSYAHMDINNCSFVFEGNNAYGMLQVYGTVNLTKNDINIERNPMYRGPLPNGSIHVQADPTSIDHTYSQLIRINFDKSVDNSIRKSIFQDNNFNFDTDHPEDQVGDPIEGMSPFQAIYCNINSDYMYTLDCKNNLHFVSANCGYLPNVAFGLRGYDFASAPGKDWIYYRKLNWQLCNYSMEGKFNFQSDAEEFRFYLYSMCSAVTTIGRRILPVAPFSLKINDNLNTPKITVTDYKIGFTGSLEFGDVIYGYYPLLDGSTPRVTPTQSNYGNYQFAHILGAGGITKDNAIWSNISLFNYLGTGGLFNKVLERSILFNAVTEYDGEQGKLISASNLDLVTNTRDIVDSGIINTLSTGLTTTNTNLTTTNSNLTSLTTRVTTAEGRINTNTDNIGATNTSITNVSGRVTTLEGRVNQDLRIAASPSFAGATIAGVTWSAALVRIGTLESTTSNYLNQSVKTTATPVFPDVTINGSSYNSVITSINSNITQNTNILNANINQAVKNTSNVTFGTVTGQSGNANSVSAFDHILKAKKFLTSDATDSGYYDFQLIRGSMVSGNSNYWIFGRDANPGNVGEFEFNYQGNANSLNACGFGFHSKKVLWYTYGGLVGIGTQSPGYTLHVAGNGLYTDLLICTKGVQLGNTAPTTLTAGQLKYNNTSNLPQFYYNGWNDLATASSVSTLSTTVSTLSSSATSTVGKMVGHIDFTFCKSDQNAFGYLSVKSMSGVVNGVSAGGGGTQDRLTIGFNSDPGNVIANINIMSQTANMPSNFKLVGIRDGSLQYALRPSVGGPSWTDPSDIFTQLGNLYSIMPASSGIQVCVTLFRY